MRQRGPPCTSDSRSCDRDRSRSRSWWRAPAAYSSNFGPRGRRPIGSARTRVPGEGWPGATDRLLMTDLVDCDAGITARLAFSAVRRFGLGRPSTKARAHELLAGVAGHPTRLGVAVFHSLLLSSELGARWCC